MSNFTGTGSPERPGGDDLLLVDRVEGQLTRELAVRRGQGDLRLPHQQAMAEAYGVSIKTVRQALGRLRERNLVRSIRGKGTFIVGEGRAGTDVLVVCRYPTHPYTMMCVAVAGTVLADQQRTSILVVSNDPAADWPAIARRHASVAGIVLIGAYPRDVVVKLVRQSKLPIVHVGDLDEEVQGPAVCDMVCSDNMAMAYRATEHLIAQGHRRIAMVGWERSKVWTREMTRGYRDAMKAHGIEPRPEWTVFFPSMHAGTLDHQELTEARRQIDEWFRGSEPPTAMIHPGASESQIRDMLHVYFRDQFAEQDVVPFVYFEMLQSGYTGLREATAVAVRGEDLIRRAVELLGQNDRSRPPVRETHARIMLCRRMNGVWKEAQ